jgi:hypothetical protein
MADIAYILCTLTSIGCAALLLRGYKQSGSRLLFWSGLCFVGLAVNNILLIVDLRLLPGIDRRVADDFRIDMGEAMI